MKLSEIPENYKIYTVKMTNKSEYKMTGDQKMTVLNSNTQFVELKDGTCINKSYIIEFKLDIDKTYECANYHIKDIQHTPLLSDLIV